MKLKAFWLIAAGLTLLLWGRGIISEIVHPYPNLVDFVQEWTSARSYLSGDPIYMELKVAVALHLGNGRSEGLPDGSFNPHPPASVLLALPFGLLDYPQGLVAWTLLSLAALAASFLLIVRQPGLGYTWFALLPILTVVLNSNPLKQQIHHGQLNLFLLLLITGAWAAERAGHRGLGAAQIALAASLKIFPAFLFLKFLYRLEMRSLFVGGMVFAVSSATSVAVLGIDSALTYVTEVLPVAGRYSDQWTNASLAGFWSKLFDAPSGHVIPLWHNPMVAKVLTLISSCVVIAAVALRAGRAESVAECDLAFALCIIAMLLVSPATWDHYFLLLILPLALIWRITPGTLFDRSFLIAVVTLLAANPNWLWRALIAGDGEWAKGAGQSVALPIHTLTIISYPFYALVSLFGFAFFTKTTNPPPPAGTRACVELAGSVV